MKNIKIKKIDPLILTGSFGDQKYYGYNNKKKIVSLVKIVTNSGHYGYGESLAGIYDPEIFTTNLKILSSEFNNKNLHESLDHCIKLQKNKFFLYQGILKNILASIEIGLFNLIAKIKNETFASIINRLYFKNKLIENNFVNIYASTGSILSTDKEILDDINKLKKLGIDKIKVRLKTTNFKNKLKILENNTQSFAIDLIANTYEKNRNSINLSNFFKNIKSKKLLWLEEVLNTNDIESFSKLKKKYNIPFSYGENFNSYYDFINLIKFYKFDFINLDISHCTISDLCMIVKYMIKNKMKKKIIFHCWGGVVNLHTSIELAALLNEFVYMVEFPTTNFTLNNKFVKNSKLKNSKYYFNDDRNNIKDFYHNFTKKNKNINNSTFKFD